MQDTDPDRALTVVLREDVTRGQVERACSRRGWLRRELPPASDTSPARVVFTTPDGLTLISFVSDPRMNAQFFVLTGSDPEAVATVLHASLPTYSREDLERLLERPDSAGDYLRGVAYTVMSCPAGAARIAEILAAALRHPSRGVRAGALSIAYWSGDPHAKELVAAVSTDDDDTGVRLHARALLGSWPA